MSDPSLEPPLVGFDLRRRLVAEALGSALLLAVVVGSGIMGERLAGGNGALALLGNTLATGSALTVLITIFGPLSGAHFNPAVTLVFAVRGELERGTAVAYAAAQLAGAVVGVCAANLMFDHSVLEVSTKLREGLSQAFSEAVATACLILVILGSLRFRPQATPALVGLYIASAYWFTASTSFANPAVTIARTLSDSFAGIAPSSAPTFIAAQLAGAVIGAATARWLFAEERKS